MDGFGDRYSTIELLPYLKLTPTQCVKFAFATALGNLSFPIHPRKAGCATAGYLT